MGRQTGGFTDRQRGVGQKRDWNFGKLGHNQLIPHASYDVWESCWSRAKIHSCSQQGTDSVVWP